MQLTLPELSLVVLMGPSGAGKSTFAAAHFKPTEVVSSDVCRALICDDPGDQSITAEAFDLLHTVVRKRLAAGKLTVVDATSVRPEDRRAYVEMAKAHHVLAVAIVLDMPPDLCAARNAQRVDRQVAEHVSHSHSETLRSHHAGLKHEGFRQISVFTAPEELTAVQVLRQKMPCNHRADAGPFDIIGDVHGCFEELVHLLERLGYAVDKNEAAPTAVHPGGRRALFLGDLVDRGPKPAAVLRLAMHMARHHGALCVPGNHDDKLQRCLQGRQVTRSHGLAETMEALATEPEAFREEVSAFVRALPSHLVLDGGKLVAVHGGMRANLQGRDSPRVRTFALYGDATGETDGMGLPIRADWAARYRGRAKVIYGHTPVPEAVWVNGTLCIDTGCAFGGKLTALRYPELDLVQVPALRAYAAPLHNTPQRPA